MFHIGDLLHMKGFKHHPNKTDWVSFKHPDKDSAFVFMFIGCEKLDGSTPLPTTEIMQGLGWGCLEGTERAIAEILAEYKEWIRNQNDDRYASEMLAGLMSKLAEIEVGAPPK